MNPGDQSDAIEQYLRAKGHDGYNVSAEAYKAALRIAALGIIPPAQNEPEPESNDATQPKTRLIP